MKGVDRNSLDLDKSLKVSSEQNHYDGEPQEATAEYKQYRVKKEESKLSNQPPSATPEPISSRSRKVTAAPSPSVQIKPLPGDLKQLLDSKKAIQAVVSNIIQQSRKKAKRESFTTLEKLLTRVLKELSTISKEDCSKADLESLEKAYVDQFVRLNQEMGKLPPGSTRELKAQFKTRLSELTGNPPDNRDEKLPEPKPEKPIETKALETSPEPIARVQTGPGQITEPASLGQPQAANLYTYQPQDRHIAGPPAFHLKPLSVDFANEKLNAFRQEMHEHGARNYPAQYSFSQLMNKTFETVMSQEEQDQVTDSNPFIDRTATYDFDCLSQWTDLQPRDGIGVFAPNKSCQVKLKNVDGTEEAIPVSRVIYDGKQAGLAMMSPASDQLESICKMALQEKAGVFVDLVSDHDRQKPKAHYQSRLNWNTIPEEGQQFGEYRIRRVGPEQKHWISDQGMGENTKAMALQRTFEITGPGGQAHRVQQISFPDWPDGDALATDALERLHQVIDSAEKQSEGALVVNCIGGVGRTGTLFATRHLRKKAKTGRLDPSQLNAEVLDTVIQGKVSRNYSFVQFPIQLVRILEAAEGYVNLPAAGKPSDQAPVEPVAKAKASVTTNTDQVSKPKSKATVQEKVTIGQWQYNPLTGGLTKPFTFGMERIMKQLREGGREGPQKARTEYNRLMSRAIVMAAGKNVTDAIHIQSDRKAIRLSPKAYSIFDNSDPNYIAPRSKNATPLAHTQVKIRQDSKNPIKMAANQMYASDGSEAGIAMQAPRPEELDLTLEMAWENKAGVMLDLTSHRDHEPGGHYAKMGQYFLDWNSIDNKDQPATPGIIGISEEDIRLEMSIDWTSVKVPAQQPKMRPTPPKVDLPEVPELTLPLDVTTSREASLSGSMVPPRFELKRIGQPETKELSDARGKKYPLTIHTFSLEPKGMTDEETRQIRVISFPSWPDGGAIPRATLKALVETVEQYLSQSGENNHLIVNCVAGLGRTGTFYAAKDIHQQARKNPPNKQTLGVHALNAAVVTRLSRSDDMIQSPVQMKSLMDFEGLYLKDDE